MATQILIADDHGLIRAGLRAMLQNIPDFTVVGEAENGIVLLSLVLELNPDIVLMDISMPEMDGLNALRAIRELDPSARVAMLTAMGQQNVVIEAIKSGAKDFIVKPFEPDRILKSLSKLLM